MERAWERSWERAGMQVRRRRSRSVSFRSIVKVPFFSRDRIAG